MSVPRETIAAVATAQGRGGVGIVRISGPLASVPRRKAISGRELKPRYAHYGPFFR
jgi:tRNA modification GTPase